MADFFQFALPLTALASIVMSAFAAIGIVVSSYVRSQNRNHDVLRRVVHLEEDIRKDSKILRDLQERLDAYVMAQSDMKELTDVARRLKSKACDIYLILKQIEIINVGVSGGANAQTLETVKLSAGVSNLSLDDIVSRIEDKSREMNGSPLRIN